jgi:hypothetical protein
MREIIIVCSEKQVMRQLTKQQLHARTFHWRRNICNIGLDFRTLLISAAVN